MQHSHDMAAKNDIATKNDTVSKKMTRAEKIDMDVEKNDLEGKNISGQKYGQ